MAIGNITFNKGQGGLGRPLPGQDYISGLLFYPPLCPVWAANTYYAAGVIVNNTSEQNYYQCLYTNIDSSFTPTNWTLLGPTTATAWAANGTSYTPGEVVSYNGNYYECIIANTSGANFIPGQWTGLGTVLNDYLPGTWANNPYVALFSPSDANTNGILPAYNKNDIYADSNYTDATPATAILTIAQGVTNNTVSISANVLSINENAGGTAVSTIALGSYTQQSTDTSSANVAAGLTAAINANTIVTGFSAYNPVSSPTVYLQFPRSQGIFPNAGAPVSYSVNSVSGTSIGVTLIQPSGGSGAIPGTQSLQAIWYYHISEFFRMQPQGQLYVGVNPLPDSFTFTEITGMQIFSGGIVRQVGVYIDGASISPDNSAPFAFNPGDLTTIHVEILANDDAYHMPLSALYCANIAGTTDLSTLPNLATLTANKASAVISQDGAAFGNFLYQTGGFTIGNLGALLGTVALSSVSDDIMWVGQFNVSDGQECQTPAFGNGTLVSSVSQNLLTFLDNNRYIFLLKYIGNSGTFWNEGNTAINESSDYAYIENNRTIDKADRGIYSSLLPALGSPLIVNADGTLTNETIAYFTSLAKVNLDQMVRDQELSAYAVLINPAQNVLSTSTLVITVQLVPVGVARTIEVNIGYTVSIQS